MFHCFRAVAVKFNPIKRAVRDSKFAFRGQTRTFPMMSEIGARRPAGIMFPTKGNTAIFERLKTTSLLSFNVIMDRMESGMLNSKGRVSRFWLSTNSKLAVISSM